MIDSQNITNTEFLQGLFGQDHTTAHVCSFAYDPGKIQAGEFPWAGGPYGGGALPDGENQYFCISQFHLHESGRQYRRKALFKYCGVIVLDDVYEKLPIELVKMLPSPSYILETSPGSQQWGYKLDRPVFMDYSRDVIDNLLDGLVLQGVCPSQKDPGMRGVTRYVRLPEGWNLKERNCNFDPKGVKCRLLAWNPDRVVTAEAMAAPFNIDLSAARHQSSNAAGYDGDDHPTFKVLNNLGLIKSYEGDGCYDITCPSVHEHTDSIDNGCEVKLWPNGGANISCYHGHGETLKEGFRNWLRHQPGYAADYREFKRVDSSAAFAAAGVLGVGEQEGPASAGPLAAIMPEEINTRILGILSGYFDGQEQAEASYFPEPLKTAWSKIFYSGSKARAFLFNGGGDLIQCPDAKVHGYIDNIFGQFLDTGMIFAHEQAAGGQTAAGVIKNCFRVFMEMVEINHQRETINYKVDMFADHARMDIRKDGVNVTYPFQPLACKNLSNCTPFEIESIVNDYREHFPEFDQFLQLLCAARFAPTAREGYIWLNVMSDWGKTFLLNGVLGAELGIVVEASMSEIEKVFTGNPIGKTAQDFIRAWVLFVDEATVIKGEIKQLDSHISGAPKNQLSFSAQVYTKVFASATSIASFAGEAGVEVQFDNRFSYMAPKGGQVLRSRELFMASKFKYREALAVHVASVLNGYVQQMRDLGAVAAASYSDELLHTLHEKWRISKSKGSLEESHTAYAAELRDLIKRLVEGDMMAVNGLSKQTKELFDMSAGNLVRGHHAHYGEVVVLKKPAKLVKAWLLDQVDRSESGKLLYSHEDLLDRLSDSDVRLHKLNGGNLVIKGVLIRL